MSIQAVSPEFIDPVLREARPARTVDLERA